MATISTVTGTLYTVDNIDIDDLFNLKSIEKFSSDIRCFYGKTFIRAKTFKGQERWVAVDHIVTVRD